jgi:hypothetical protein
MNITHHAHVFIVIVIFWTLVSTWTITVNTDKAATWSPVPNLYIACNSMDPLETSLSCEPFQSSDDIGVLLHAK